MVKEALKGIIAAFTGSPLVRVVDGVNSRLMTPANLVAETGARAALDARHVKKAGDTLSGDLQIQKATPAIVVDSDTATTGRLWFQRNNVNCFALEHPAATPGVLNINRYNPATGAYLSTPLQLRDDGSIHVPAITATNQPAQVTAYQASTGRLAIGGREIGDTGWRKVLSWTAGVQDAANQIGTIHGSWTLSGTGYVQLRRVGNRVFLRIPFASGNTLKKTSGGGVPGITALLTAAVWPSGFGFTTLQRSMGALRPSGTPQLSVYYSFAAIQSQVVTTDVRIQVFAQDVELEYFTADWLTEQAWPASLPGVV